MDPVTSIGSLISGISTSISIIKTAVQARDDAKANEAAKALSDQFVQLQSTLLDAQQKAMLSMEKVGALSEEVAALKAAISELTRKRVDLEKYELTSIAEGPVMYRLKGSGQADQPSHYRCTSCVDAGKSGYLQPVRQKSMLYLICPDCRFEYPAANLPPPDWDRLLERLTSRR